MCASFIGFALSKIFLDSTSQLFKSNFSLNNFLIGWLLQDHFKELHHLTGGKRFVSEIDFIGKLIILILKILGNCILYSYQFTFIFLFCHLIIFVLISRIIKKNQFFFIYSYVKIILILFYFSCVLLKLYLLFGILIFENIILVIFIFLIVISAVFLTYTFLYSVIFKNAVLIVKIAFYKYCTWTIWLVFYLNQIFFIMDSLNLISKNILKEFIFKTLYFF